MRQVLRCLLLLLSLERSFGYEKNRLMDHYDLLGYKSDANIGICCNRAFPFLVQYLDG